jgi:hypothetical protein
MFLSEYGVYPNIDYPEDRERNKGAVDAIAKDQYGSSLAMEHTLIQPFDGEREDAQPFSRVFEPINQDTSLAVPGHLITISPSVGSVPKGVDWKEISVKIIEWFRNEKDLIPDGISTVKIPALPFDLTLTVEKIPMNNSYPGYISVGRTNPPDTSETVIKKALSDKLPKLSATTADKRILLFEQNDILRSPFESRRIVKYLDSRFPDLASIDEVWVALTPFWEIEKFVWFIQVWPENVERKFKLID